MTKERAFSATRAAHDDECRAFLDFEIYVMLDDTRAVCHRQADDFNGALRWCMVGIHGAYQIFRMTVRTVMTADARVMQMMLETTAEVAACPTAVEFRPHLIPW